MLNGCGKYIRSEVNQHIFFPPVIRETLQKSQLQKGNGDDGEAPVPRNLILIPGSLPATPN